MPGHSNNPEAVQQKFIAIGWAFDAFSAGKCRCGQCVRRQADARRGESPKHVNGAQPMNVPALKVVPPSKTELTVDDKKRLRDLLAGVFDEDKGFYLDSSDARVAADLVLPEALVRKYREDAFGPLKSVPEFDSIKVEIDALQERSRAAVREATAIDQAVIALRAKAEQTLQRLGVKP